MSGVSAGQRVGSRVAGTTWPRLAAFLGLGAAVVLFDQASKAWVNASFALSRASGAVAAPLAAPTPVLGDFVRIAKGYNNGAIFSLFGSSASIFAIGSLVAIAVIIWFEVARGGRTSWWVTIALGLLLGGATGNLIDRVRLGYVIDFVDMGIGTWRWYTFNVADAAISVSIVMLLLAGLVGEAGGTADAGARPGSRDGRASTDASGSEARPGPSVGEAPGDRDAGGAEAPGSHADGRPV